MPTHQPRDIRIRQSKQSNSWPSKYRNPIRYRRQSMEGHSYRLVKNINMAQKHIFISFGIVDFYPSITENLLKIAISWAGQRTPITAQEINIIKHARKSLLFNDGKTWIKRNSKNISVRCNNGKVRRGRNTLADWVIHLEHALEKIQEGKYRFIQGR